MRTVSVGIIGRGGLVLACQRKRDAAYPLKWEFPGGKMEDGETTAQALVRELQEELGIEAVVGTEFHRQEWVYREGVTDPARDGSFRVFYHLVPSFSGDPVNRAFHDIRWVTPRQLLTMDILEGNREVVQKLADQTRG
jgi:8-oxo-dGTP diphosphatase